MMQLKTWGVIWALILAIGTLNAETKRYDIQSGIIEYTTNGGGNMMGIETKIEGKNRLVFKEWGNIELYDEISKSMIMGREEHTHQTTKIMEGKVYIVNYDQKSISEYDPAMLMHSQYKDISKSAKEMMVSMGGKKTGVETILGYECEIWESKMMKLWLHKGVILRSEVNMMGITHKTEAINVQIDISVSDDALKLPDFPIKTMEQNDPAQMPQMTPEQMQQMQEMMKSFTQK